jgi:hypothetical protein
MINTIVEPEIVKLLRGPSGEWALSPTANML